MKKKSFIPVFLFIAALAFGVSCKEKPAKVETPAVAPEHSKAVEGYSKGPQPARQVAVARVNGVEITARDLVNEMNRIAPRLVKPGEQGSPAIEEKVKRKALDLLIFRELAIQEARKRGTKVPPEEVDGMLNRLKARLQSEDAFKAFLAKTGLSELELRKEMEKQVLYSMIMRQEILSKVKLDPEAVRREYAENKAAYKGPEGQLTLEQARPMIERKLAAPVSGKMVEELSMKLRQPAKIEVMPESTGKEIHKAGP